jgi:DNA-binding GntR family transcriptional regulator
VPVAATTADHPDQDEAAFAVSFRLDRKQPVSDQIYDALKQAIVSVRLLPGTSISENRICRHFGVSRTPVRTAIVRLAEEGLIDVYPQQGSFVAPIRLSGIAASRFVRRVLEAAVLREAAQRWTPEMSREARAIIASQAEAIAAGDVERFHREDERFHRAFSVFAGREAVWNTILAAKASLGRVVRLFGDPDRLPVVVAEHTAIIDALDARDGDEAVRRLEYHLDKIFHMIEQLPERYRPYVTD